MPPAPGPRRVPSRRLRPTDAATPPGAGRPICRGAPPMTVVADSVAYEVRSDEAHGAVAVTVRELEDGGEVVTFRLNACQAKQLAAVLDLLARNTHPGLYEALRAVDAAHPFGHDTVVTFRDDRGRVRRVSGEEFAAGGWPADRVVGFEQP